MKDAFEGGDVRFGRDYLIPKPLDPRILFWVAPAVAKAAMDTSVARHPLDIKEYVHALEARRQHCARRCQFKDSCFEGE